MGDDTGSVWIAEGGASGVGGMGVGSLAGHPLSTAPAAKSVADSATRDRAKHRARREVRGTEPECNLERVAFAVIGVTKSCPITRLGVSATSRPKPRIIGEPCDPRSGKQLAGENKKCTIRNVGCAKSRHSGFISMATEGRATRRRRVS